VASDTGSATTREAGRTAPWRRIVLGGWWLLIAGSILGAVTIATIVYQYSAVSTVVESGFQRQVAAESALLADVVATLPVERRADLAGHHPDRERRLTIIDPKGRVAADTHGDPGQMEDHASRPEVVEAKVHGMGVDRRRSATTGRETIYAATTLPDGWIVRVAMPVAAESSLVVSTWLPMAIGAAVVVAVTALLAMMQLFRDQQRFGALAAVARGFGEGAYDRRAGLMGEDALARLGHELNRLGDRLASSRAELRAQQALLDSALGALSEGVACIDPLDRIVYANPAFCRLVGADAIAGMPLWNHLADAGVVQALGRLRADPVLRAIDAIACEHRQQHLMATVVPADDGVIVLVLYDRTEVHRLESIRRSFVASVSHEFKTPLTSIIGYTDTLLDHVLAEDRDMSREFVNKIANHAARLETLVRDVLTLSRLEQGGWTPAPVDLDLSQIAAEVVDAHAPVAGHRQVSLAVEAPESLPLRTDAEMVRQVLSNLLSNAIRYNRVGGRAVVRLRPGTDVVEIDVADTGIGIPSAHRARIFERFYRVDTHRSRNSGGTGLGLAIVKHMVDQLDGMIEFTTGDQGTTFTVRLPRTSPH
jgi:two-component system phosphate regulon sensor histidine kinase PhoR